MDRRGVQLLGFALGLALAIPGVAQQMPSTNASQTSTTTSQTQKGPYDRQIQQDVQQRLSGRDKFRNVQATTEDAIVTLTGTVQNYNDKEDAERQAKKTEHVAGVRNQIQVAGPMVPDTQLAQKVADRLRYDRVDQGIMFNDFSLNVKNGVVTVSGQALNEANKASALAVVAGTPGVKGVVDNIQVAPASPNDDELRIAVARAVYGAAPLQKYAIDPQAPIRIIVQNGHVTLAGVVDNQMDKTVALTQAKSVPGVFSVDDKLVVAGQGAH
jgi:hyperosmotically inducible periplasmic protein